MRYSLEHGTSRSVPLGDEISATKMYLEIEQVRFADRLSVEFDIADEASQANVPSFLLQPLIENAIKHAIALSEEAGKILISARCEDQILCIAVEDTGASESQAARRQAWGAGVGLSNVRERIAATYGEDDILRTGKSGLGGAPGGKGGGVGVINWSSCKEALDALKIVSSIGITWFISDST